jgi:integrase
VRKALAELSGSRTSDSACVFPAPTDVDGTPKPIDIESARRLALKQADVMNSGFHDLRHSAASYLAMNGESPLVIAAVLGHKTLQMVKRYAHLSEARTSAVVERMNSVIFPTPS